MGTTRKHNGSLINVGVQSPMAIIGFWEINLAPKMGILHRRGDSIQHHWGSTKRVTNRRPIPEDQLLFFVSNEGLACPWLQFWLVCFPSSNIFFLKDGESAMEGGPFWVLDHMINPLPKIEVKKWNVSGTIHGIVAVFHFYVSWLEKGRCECFTSSKVTFAGEQLWGNSDAGCMQQKKYHKYPIFKDLQLISPFEMEVYSRRVQQVWKITVVKWTNPSFTGLHH